MLTEKLSLMKPLSKIIFTSIVSFTLATFSFGQPIQVDCYGNVGIGTAPSPSYKFKVDGTLYTTNLNVWGQGNINYLTVNNDSYFSNGYYPGIIISNDPLPYGKALYPSSNNTCRIGLSNQAFSEIWSYSGSISLSDLRQKENIRDINNPLDLVMQLKGVRYDLKKEFAYSDTIVKDSKLRAKCEKQRKDKIGFIAQDVYKILPEVVVYDDSTDIYGIEYSKVVPILVEAIKEQQLQIETLRKLITDQEEDILEFKTFISDNKLKSSNILPLSGEQYISEHSTLYQNTPNPFTQSTSIGYYLPETVGKAAITIYNINGTQLKSIALQQRGQRNITLAGGEFKPGIYLYALIVDGQLIDTKRMVLTD